MIEILDKKERLLGYVERKKYYDENRDLIGFIEETTYKMNDGCAILTLDDDKFIMDEEDEDIGYLDNNYFRFPESWMFKFGWGILDMGFSPEKGELYNHKGKIIGFVRGDIEHLTEIDYFGILVSFFDLGA